MSYRCAICDFPNGEADFYNKVKTSKRYFRPDPDNPNQKICLKCIGEYEDALADFIEEGNTLLWNPKDD